MCDDRADYQQQANEDAHYHFVLCELANMVREFGARQVQHDLNKYFECDTCHFTILERNAYVYVPEYVPGDTTLTSM